MQKQMTSVGVKSMLSKWIWWSGNWQTSCS